MLLVYFDRDGYIDNNDPPRLRVDLVDSIYYTTVTLSTTGYGDIAPVEPHARLINAFVITPLRIAFLVLLIGTTLEVLASQGREMFRVARWRKNMGDHVVVIGYGTKGRSAVETLINNGQDREAHRRRRHRRRSPCRTPTPTGWPSSPATPPGAACCAGPASRRPARSSSPPTATTPTCSPTLTVRQLNPDAWIVVGGARAGERRR